MPQALAALAASYHRQVHEDHRGWILEPHLLFEASQGANRVSLAETSHRRTKAVSEGHLGSFHRIWVTGWVCRNVHVGILLPGTTRGNHRHRFADGVGLSVWSGNGLFSSFRRRPTVTASRSSPRSAEVILVWGSSARWRFEPQSGSARYEEHESSQFTLLSQCYKPRTTTQSIRCNRMVRRTSHWPALGWISGLTHSVRYWFRMARHMPYV